MGSLTELPSKQTMNNTFSLIEVAQLGRLVGLKGELKLHLHCDFPEQFKKGKTFQTSRGETLEVLYKGKNISQILDFTVEDARQFFDAVPTLARKLQTLMDVGLGYIRLGQSATTLSGGEAQRIKLATELSKKRHRKHILYFRRTHNRLTF